MYTEELSSSIARKKLLNSEHIGDYAEIGDWKIHYYEQGEGTPLLLVHGFGQSLYTWHKVINELSEYYHVIALDLPGCGYSSVNPNVDLDIDSMAELLVRFLDTVGVKTCDAVGFSLGAMYVLRAVELHPRRFHRLVLASPGGITNEMPFSIKALANPMLSWLFKLMISPRMVRNILSECFFDQTQITEEMIKETFIPIETSEAKKSQINILQNFDEETTMQGLREIQHEILIIWGVDDQWHLQDLVEQFSLSINYSKLVSIRNCGHIIHEEKIEKFLGSVLEFLEWGLEESFFEDVETKHK